MNTERKRLLKQRREKVLQSAKDRKLAKANALVALQAGIRANTASKDTQDITMADNAAINAEYTDNAAIDVENTDDAATSDNNIDKAAIDGQNIDDAAIGHDNTDNAIIGEASTVHVSLPPHYGGKDKDPSQIKTSAKCTHAIAEPLTGDPIPDGHNTVKAGSHTVHLSDVHIYEFLIQGTPHPCDLEGIEEDQLLEIQRNIQDKLKQRDEEEKGILPKESNNMKRNMILLTKPY